MNSMNKIIEDIKSKYNVLNIEQPTKQQVSFDFESRDIHAILAYLKSIGWNQLTFLTCVDFIDDKEFQLVFILMNWETGITIQVRTRLDREKPLFKTIVPIFPGAKFYERDVHEFFGVEFEGNEDSKKGLFLELWDDIPPMRKDFDPQKYSDKKYAKRDYNVDFKKEGEER
ncbi:NADH-quinone oxidoreductase subunit C [Haliovirga abyssi]|uniref:NADH dehydrogenase n=1 Tax=Haliovirga abyssi TaxID=2996794 RepID=A0AAU9DBR4_9FUSO|nr:NADH-quinone oxidoreductase subunit C [Haliovirga abyssi]BDU50725.1 NADH dehydrogenase [Haliovirga abyssi]